MKSIIALVILSTILISTIHPVLSSDYNPEMQCSKSDGDNPGIQWTKTYGTSWSNDEAYKARQTPDGGYIFSGNTNAYLPPQDWSAEWILKTDSKGNEQWNKTYPTNGNLNFSDGADIQPTTDGGYILIGTLTNHTSSYGTLKKIDANGTIQWATLFPESGPANSGGQTNDGGYIIAGESNLSQPWLAKTDANGTELWNHSYITTNYHGTARCVQQTHDSGFILTGRLDCDNENQTCGYLVKTDADGNQQWKLTYGQPNNITAFESVHQTPDGGYAMVGPTSIVGIPGDVIYLVRTDSNGTILWNRTYFPSPTMGRYANDMELTRDGGFVLTGETEGFTTQSWVIKTNANGTMEWSMNITEKYWVSLTSVQETRDEGYILAGISNIDTGDDAFLMKLEHIPHVTITTPQKAVYVFGREGRSSLIPFIIGPITVQTDAWDTLYPINQVEFKVNGVLKATVTTPPYVWRWQKPMIFPCILEVIVINNLGVSSKTDLLLWKLF